MRSIQSVVGSCSHVPQVASIKLIRNKQTGQSFSEFLSREAAEKVLQTYNGTIMPNTDQAFRLNWASFSTGEKHADNNGGSYLSIFIEDLAPDATDTLLYETFAGRYPSVKGAKVVVDTNIGCSKGGAKAVNDDVSTLFMNNNRTSVSRTVCQTAPSL
ncbi:polyadenylate-binding protein RBP47-like protein [Tanacetum coccineum]